MNGWIGDGWMDWVDWLGEKIGKLTEKIDRTRIKVISAL